MSYDVVVGELRAAAGRYETMVGGLACYSLTIANAEPDSLGHVELAAWLTAVVDQCNKAGRALHDGAVGLSASLEATAARYEQADQASAQRFQDPFGLLGTPFGPTAPHAPGAPGSPVLGPPAPTSPVLGPPAPGSAAGGSR